MIYLKTDSAKSDVVLKELGALEIKDAEKGEVEAIIASFGVIDKDFDVILDTAIPDGSKVKMSSYGHEAMYGERPVGKGALFSEAGKAIFRGKMFLTTQDGRESFEVLKEMGKDQEWSFGFKVLGSEIPDEKWQKLGARRILTKLDCFEVSPVMRGAGVGTRTLAVKEETPPPDPAVEEPPAPVAEQQADGDQTTVDDAAATAKLEEERIAAAEQKEMTKAAVEEFYRVNRTLKRLRLV